MTPEIQAALTATTGPDEARADWALTSGDSWLLSLGGKTAANETVSERTAMGLAAVYRCVAIIAGTIAGLPCKTYSDAGVGRERTRGTWLDDPGGPLQTPFEWHETMFAHKLLHGYAAGFIHRTNAGTIAFVEWIHPEAVQVEPGGRYTLRLAKGVEVTYTDREILYIPALTLDGVNGVTPLRAAREAFGTSIAAEKAAGRLYRNGLLLGGIVTAEDDSLTDAEATTLKAKITAGNAGAARAGEILVTNRNLKFQPWTMDAHDAQFLESRRFQVEEISRVFGVPKVLLNEDGASTWGTGVAELVRGFQKFTLASWTSRAEPRLSRLLPPGEFCEYDYRGLVQPAPEVEIDLIIRQIDAGLLTQDEARAMLGRSPQPQGATT